MKKLLFSFLCVSSLSFNAFAQNSGNIIEYETSSGLTLYINANSLESFIDSKKMFTQKVKSCSRGEVNFFNPFFGTNDYYKIIGRNNNRECVVEYSHAGISKHRCSLNRYQIEDLSESINSKLNKKIDIEFKSEKENIIWSSDNCMVTYENKIDGSATQEQIDKAIKENPNIRSILMLVESEMN